ncbi:hypothetical protein FG91_04151 [Sphingopyxis sp. LC81]|uniref:hypothetical protein n=1 Tax=Sphingopyxis sp. LC81 TaxID=1502850 RepID=UPI00050F8613|nr:hypothetical protein [Sphingopyxis sp. LC81]KGB51785.1 hypothetical protein FG91_04151 [Sphingopyxis sp. LC81]
MNLVNQLQNLSTSVEFVAAIVGAIVGSIAAGAISYLMQRQMLREDRKKRKEDSAEKLEAAALSLFFKLQACMNDLRTLADHVVDAQAFAERESWDLWQALIPIPNLPPIQVFVSDDLATLVRLKDFDLYNKVRDVEVTHRSMIDSMHLYLKVRSELGRAMGADISGTHSVSPLTAEDQRRVGPMILETGGLAQSIADTVVDDAETAKDAFERYNASLKALIGHSFTIEYVRRSELKN